MKNMKKLVVLILSVLMVLGTSAVTSFAAKNDKITVTGTKEGETLKLYQMMTLKVDNEENPTAYAYYAATGWADFFTTGAGKDYVTVDATDGHITWKEGKDTEAEMIKFAQAAAAVAANLKDTKEADDSGSVEFTDLADGYYLITSSLGTKAMIETTPDKSAVTINEKNPEDTVEKKVKEDTAFGTENDAQIGDTVEFQTTAKLQPYTKNVKIHDAMDAGLTFTASSLTVTGGTPEITEDDYEVLSTPDTGDTFTIKIKDSYIATMTAESDIVISYSAVLNVAAVSATPALVDQKNKATVSYGDKQSQESETTTKTHKFSVYKHADGKTENLAGAEFALKKNGTVVKLTKIDNTNYKVDPNGQATSFITVEDADIVIWGVDTDGPYKLEELNAPKGYNKLSAEVPVTVNAGNDTRVDIENETGTELPSTGGMGTTILYIVGGVLVAVSAIMLVAKKRTSDK